VIHTIAAAQQEELEKEIVSLQAEAERVVEEVRELAGEVPF
jgi:archaellum component FlaC